MARRNILELNISTESSLETERLLENDQDAASGSDLGVLRAEVKSQVDSMVKQRDDPVESSSSSDYSSSDSDSSDDSGDDSGDDEFDMGMDEEPEDEPEEPEDEEPEEEDAEPEEEPDDNAATEAAYIYLPQTQELLDKEFRIYDHNLAVEAAALEGDNWENVKEMGKGLWEVGKVIGGLAVSVVQAFGWIGVNIVAPVAKRLYKIVIYLGAKFIRLSYLGINKIQKQIDEYTTRVEVLTKDINDAKGIVKELIRKQTEFPDNKIAPPTGTFKSVKTINRIKLGPETNPALITKTLDSFIKRWADKTSKDILNDSAAIGQVLKYGVDASINPVKTFGDSSMRKGLVADNRTTHEAPNEFVDSMRYHDVLPGDMIYCVAVPNGKAQTIDEVRTAYQGTTCSFAIEPRSFKRIEEIPHVDGKALVGILVELETLLVTLQGSISLYEDIKGERKNHMASFKRYFLTLAENDKKITLEQSMLEYVYLRAAFIDNVYTVTVRDIHRYTQGYISEVLKFVKSNLVELTS